ncbi:MAG TPA: lysylphosphatidylglycerol synthase transmembrane domain-containing protein [Aggregatilineaceae bacterium]|nr:lysylphosphatidylglycerol synthase transmembrane domain-containing protein [Aggregatilineaceae bacterium]
MKTRWITQWAQRWLPLPVGIAVSVVFLYIGLKGLKLSQVWHDVRHVHVGWLLVGASIYFLAVWGRTWRWHYLLRSIKAIPLKKLFPVVVIGYMGNNLYPFRTGEVIRAYVLRRNEDVRISASLATIVVERIFDGLVMLIFVFVALPFADFKANWLRDIVFFSTLLFWGAFLAFLVVALRPAQMRRIYTAIFDRLLPEGLAGTARSLADHFMLGLENLRRPRDLFMTLLSSVFIWLTETTKYWFVMHAFDFRVSFFALMVMTAVVNLATTLPSSPGYVGTFDTPGIKTLTAYGIEETTAASYTLVLHAALWLPITLLGVFFLYREGLHWRDFSRAREVVAGGGPPDGSSSLERGVIA